MFMCVASNSERMRSVGVADPELVFSESSSCDVTSQALLFEFIEFSCSDWYLKLATCVS